MPRIIRSTHLQLSDDPILNDTIRTRLSIARTPTIALVDSTGYVLVQPSIAVTELIENLRSRAMLGHHSLDTFVADQLGILQGAQPA